MPLGVAGHPLPPTQQHGGRLPSFWDNRYAETGYAYGTEPNAFLREHAHLLSDPVLSIAEGEGRNAVYLASLGLKVLGVDSSAVGLAKAHALAAERGVTLQTELADLRSYCPPKNSFSSIIAIFAHLPSTSRPLLHSTLDSTLLEGGCILLEAYTPAQVGRGTGGPSDPDLCPTAQELRTTFSGYEMVMLREIERAVIEGSCHTGMASVVQMIARKTAQ